MKMKTQQGRSALALAVTAALGLGVMVSAPVEAGTLSHVDDNVTGSGSTWTYAFDVFNDDVGFRGEEVLALSTDGGSGGDGQHVIIDWELPYFDDMGIDNVTSPDGWSWAIETIGVANDATGWGGVAAWNHPKDPWYQALDGANNPIFTATQVLHWYCGNPVSEGGEGGTPWVGCSTGEGDGASFGSGISPGDSLGGFGFTAAYGPTNAPYQTSWMTVPVNTGDPYAPAGATVASPKAMGTVSVPEPGSIALMSLGLMGLAGAGYRRRKLQGNGQ